MIDGHVHLEKGPLTVAYVMEMVDAAVRMGMDTLQILDHTHRFHEFEPLYTTVKARHPLQAAWLAKKGKDSLLDYHRLIEQVKALDLPIHVDFGLEVCYVPEAKSFLSDILPAYPYDFIVGSVHYIDGWLYDMPFSQELLWQKQSTDAIYRRYYALVEQMMRSGLFTQIGHPDTIKLFDWWPAYDLQPTYERLARLAKEKHLKMEDNTGCYYRYHTKDLGLNDAFLKCLLACQVDIITASDAHYPRHVGAYLREAEAKIRALS